MSSVEWLTPDEQVAWRAIVEFCGRVVDGTDTDVAPFGLTGADYEVLVHLSEARQGLRMSELADRVLVSRSRLTYRVDRLEGRGLVVRDHCETDRRGFIARLTEGGAQLLDEVAPHHVRGVRDRLVDRLDPQEFLELGRTAAKVIGQTPGPARRVRREHPPERPCVEAGVTGWGGDLP